MDGCKGRRDAVPYLVLPGYTLPLFVGVVDRIQAQACASAHIEGSAWTGARSPMKLCGAYSEAAGAEAVGAIALATSVFY